MIVKSFKILKNKIIKNKKGSVIKFLTKKNIYFKSFGEIYFSEINANKTKGWNYHKKYTCIITVPVGKVEFQIVNKREKISKIKINKDKILIIPPGNWFAFKSLSKKSLISNLINGIHSDKETKKSKKIKNIYIK